MKPTPAELIAGIRQVLDDEIEPDLQSEDARATLREIRARLAQVDWDDAGFQLAARNRALAGALAAAQTWRASHPSALPDAAVPPEAGATFAEQQRRYEQLAGRVAELARPLTAWTRANPDDTEGRELLRMVVQALAVTAK